MIRGEFHLPVIHSELLIYSDLVLVPCSLTTARRINVLTNSYAFGNMLLPNFYCPPKEIRALCILGKKHTFKIFIFPWLCVSVV